MPDALVRIWPAGHASVQLPEPHGAYITWMGGDKSRLIFNYYLADCRDLESRGVDRFSFTLVEIPLRQGDTHCGLDREGMLGWWDRHRRLGPPHHMFSKG